MASLPRSDDETVVDRPAPGDGPGDGPADPGKPKKPLWRRILKWTLVTIGVLLLLVVAFVGFLHTGPGQDFLRGKVEGVLAERFDGKVTLGGFDFTIFGDIELHDLTIAQHDGAEVIKLDDLLVTLDWGSLLSPPLTIEKLGVDGLDVDLVMYEDGTSNLARMMRPSSPPPKALTLQELDVKDVDVSITRPDGSRTTLDDLTIHGAIAFDKEAGKTTVDLDTLAVVFGLERPGLKASVPLSTGLTLDADGPNTKLALLPISTTATITRDGQAPQEVPVSLGGVDATATPGQIDLALKALVAGPLSLAGLTATIRLGPDGKPRGEQQLGLDRLVVDADGVNAIAGRAILAGDVTVDLSVAGPTSALRVGGHVGTPGGELKLAGDLDVSDPAAPAYDLTLIGRDIDTSKILVDQPPDKVIRTGFTLAAKGQGAQFGTATSHVSLTVRETTVGGKPIDGVELVVDVDGHVVALTKLELRAHAQALTAEGRVDVSTGEGRLRIVSEPKIGAALDSLRAAGMIASDKVPEIGGSLDIDLTLEGKADPARVQALLDARKRGEQLIIDVSDPDSFPLEWARIVGHVRATDLSAGDRGVDALALEADVRVADFRPKGQLSLHVEDLETGTQHIDLIDLTLGLDGLTQDIVVKVRDERQRLAVDLRAHTALDPDERQITARVDALDLKRGAAEVTLLEPITLVIDAPDPTAAEQVYELPEARLGLAGGTLALSARVRLVPDPANPGKQKLRHARANLDTQGLSIQRLAAMAGRSARGIAGRISGSLTFDGTPDAPELDFSSVITARQRDAEPVTVRMSGSVHDAQLATDVHISDAGRRPLATMKLRAPLQLQPKPGLLPGGRLVVDLDVPRTELRRFGALLADGLPPDVDPGAVVAASMHLEGTTSSPRGTWNLDLEGGLLRARGMADAPATQRVALSGELGRDGRATTLASSLQVWADATASPLVAADVAGRFERSPLLPRFMSRPWSLDATLAPIDLAQAPQMGTAPALTGRIGGKIAVSGVGDDVKGTIAFVGDDLAKADGTTPAADLAFNVDIRDDAIALASSVEVQKPGVAPWQVLALNGTVGLGGKGLLRASRRPEVVARAPLDLTLSMSPTPLSVVAAYAPKPMKAPPGRLGGAVRIGGTIGTPTAAGGFEWDDFTTLAGTPGRVGLGLDAGLETIVAGLYLGGQGALRDAPARIEVSVGRAALKTPAEGLTVALVAKADGVDLLTLVPAVDAGERGKLDVAGKLDWDLQGALHIAPDAATGKPGLDALKSTLAGHLAVRDGRVAVPDTTRVIDDILARLDLSLDTVRLTLGAHEADMQRDDRRVDVTADVALTELRPGRADVVVKTHKWLVLGKHFGSPHAELDLTLEVDAEGLSAADKRVDVTVAALELYSPNRFPRLHSPEFDAYEDLVYLDASDLPSGQLPPSAASLVTSGPAPNRQYAGPAPPPSADASPAPTTPAEPTETDPPKPPEGTITINLAIAEGAKVLFHPLDVQLHGAMVAKMAAGELDLRGQIDVTEGNIDVMGRLWPLHKGVISAEGGLDTAGVVLTFARPLHDTAQRDISLEGDHDGRVFITIVANKETGGLSPPIFHGAAGPWLIDQATQLNSGRARLWSRADLPASSNVQYPMPDGGLVATFVQTNLTHLIFMDRTNGWSDPLTWPEEYGRVYWYRGVRYLDGSRVRLYGQRPTIGRNDLELQYDWLMVNAPRDVVGFGPRLGTDARLGLGVFWEFESER